MTDSIFDKLPEEIILDNIIPNLNFSDLHTFGRTNSLAHSFATQELSRRVSGEVSEKLHSVPQIFRWLKINVNIFKLYQGASNLLARSL